MLRSLKPLDPLEIQILDAQGCVLVEDVTVATPLPPFDNSSMDGYAVRAADVEGASEEHPAVLTVVGDVAAGSGELPEVGPGQCVRIMTGAPVPPGAEAVVPVEWTDGGTGSGPVTTMPAYSGAPEGATGEVRVFRAAESGAHIRLLGSDVRPGQLALEKGTVLGPAQIGLLAAVGRSRVLVRPRPRVVVISTGSELVQPGEEIGPGRIADSNSFTLTAAARDAGAEAYRVGAVPDDAARLTDTIEDQLVRADLLVTSGGVSVGAYDVVKEVFEQLGSVRFRKLAMQPGKPQGFGRIGPDGTPLCALPGNPVSAYVSFELFVRPAIRRLMGLEPAHRPVVSAKLTDGIGRSPAGRRQFLRGRYDERTGEISPVGRSGSHLVAALARANALIVVPEDTTSVEAGAQVDVVLLT
ncbi:molybdotransferase-like divisome protein Glp [Wenjunlia tyrosinilytica]|uniref:molybdotransferase-like divisome protein Glp n=1 Tax=Wenjunlia tyrosinilytica TaxID=1544741 RepID=UPI001E35E38E|nr:gephyrin-like molybdotransferase Glp [Wenjunlia tyrosinilytica]